MSKDITLAIVVFVIIVAITHGEGRLVYDTGTLYGTTKSS